VHCSIKLIDDNTDQSEKESLTMQDALMFPLQIGAVLWGLYMLIKNFRPELINLVLRI